METVEDEFVEELGGISHPHDIKRSKGKSWEHLLGIPKAGRMRAKRRGKVVTIIAGQVSHAIFSIELFNNKVLCTAKDFRSLLITGNHSGNDSTPIRKNHCK